MSWRGGQRPESTTSPTVPGAEQPSELLLRRVAAWGLPGPTELDIDDGRDLGGQVTATTLDRAVDERVIGLLSVAAASGHLELAPRWAERAAERHREALLWCLRLENRLLHLVDVLATHGVSPIVLKGPAAAHLDEIDPSLRPFADLDLLIEGPDVDRAVAAVLADGAGRPTAERRPGFDRRFAKSVTLRYPDGVEIDLHRSLCDGVHGFRIPLERLVEQRVPFEVGGTSLWALGQPHRMLSAAYHLALGSPVPRLVNLRDLAGHLTDPKLDNLAVLDEVMLWRGEEVLVRAVGICLEVLGVDAPIWQNWLDDRSIDATEASIVEQQRLEGSAVGRGKVRAIRELPGLRSQVAYAWALALPTNEHLRSRGLRRRDLVSHP